MNKRVYNFTSNVSKEFFKVAILSRIEGIFDEV